MPSRVGESLRRAPGQRIPWGKEQAVLVPLQWSGSCAMLDWQRPRLARRSRRGVCAPRTGWQWKHER
eukprot:5731989-Pyramimonas_sp.AAC.1